MWKHLMERLERIWIAATFAEAGERETALAWAGDDADQPAQAPGDESHSALPRPPAAAH